MRACCQITHNSFRSFTIKCTLNATPALLPLPPAHLSFCSSLCSRCQSCICNLLNEFRHFARILNQTRHSRTKQRMEGARKGLAGKGLSQRGRGKPLRTLKNQTALGHTHKCFQMQTIIHHNAGDVNFCSIHVRAYPLFTFPYPHRAALPLSANRGRQSQVTHHCTATFQCIAATSSPAHYSANFAFIMCCIAHHNTHTHTHTAGQRT